MCALKNKDVFKKYGISSIEFEKRSSGYVFVKIVSSSGKREDIWLKPNTYYHDEMINDIIMLYNEMEKEEKNGKGVRDERSR